MKNYNYHYVYRITNIISGQHYYGDRSCDCLPTDDLGKKYFSSFTEDWFKQDQLENPNNYKYKIIRIYTTCREDATAFESKLHEKFNVKDNIKFVNKANQHKNGCKFKNSTGKVNVIDTMTKKRKQITKEEYSENKDRYKSFLTEKVIVVDTRDNTKKRISKKIFEKFNYYKPIHSDKITVLDKSTNTIMMVSREEFNTNKNLVGARIGTVPVIDLRDKIKKSVSVLDFETYDYYVAVTAKNIKIFDESDNMIHDIYGNFRDFCKKNKLPENAFRNSYKNEGEKIYTHLNKVPNHYKKFAGWYAKIENL